VKKYRNGAVTQRIPATQRFCGKNEVVSFFPDFRQRKTRQVKETAGFIIK